MSDRPIDESNPYRPPSAALSDPPEESVAVPFFATSQAKLAIMSVATFGIYDIWWFYKNWVAVRTRTGRKVWAGWRALFAPFFSFSLFYELETEAKTAGLQARFAPALCGAAFFVLSAMSRLPDPYWVVSIFAFVPIMPANAVAQRLNASLAPRAVGLAPWSALNIIGAALGLAFVAFILLAPEPAPEP